MTATARLTASLRRLPWRRVRAWASYAAQRLGHVGLAGLALALAAGGFALAERAAVHDTVLARAAADGVRAQWQRDSAAPAPAADAGSLLAALPPAEQVAGFIEDLHRGAARGGVTVERAEYRTPALAGGRVQRAQVVLPVVGRYPDVGAWLAALLQAHPSTALDEFAVQRDAGPGRVRARVVLSHYSLAAP